MELFGQIISIIAMCAIILSFQCKSNKKLAVVLKPCTFPLARYFSLVTPIHILAASIKQTMNSMAAELKNISGFVEKSLVDPKAHIPIMKKNKKANENNKGVVQDRFECLFGDWFCIFAPPLFS